MDINNYYFIAYHRQLVNCSLALDFKLDFVEILILLWTVRAFWGLVALLLVFFFDSSANALQYVLKEAVQMLGVVNWMR